MLENIQRIDFSILNFIRKHCTNKFLDFLMPKITHLADFGAVWMLFAGYMLFSKPDRNNGILLFLELAIGVCLASLILKPITKRSRPFWIKTEVVPIIKKTPSDYSFPSGHTLASFISATFITMTAPHLAIIAIPLAILISFSRLYLYVHFPSDVFFSMLLGIAIPLVSYSFLYTKLFGISP